MARPTCCTRSTTLRVVWPLTYSNCAARPRNAPASSKEIGGRAVVVASICSGQIDGRFGQLRLLSMFRTEKFSLVLHPWLRDAGRTSRPAAEGQPREQYWERLFLTASCPPSAPLRQRAVFRVGRISGSS